MTTSFQYHSSSFPRYGYRSKRGRYLVYSVTGRTSFPRSLLIQEDGQPWTEDDLKLSRCCPVQNLRTGRPDLATVFITARRCTPAKWERMGWMVSKVVEEVTEPRGSYA